MVNLTSEEQISQYRERRWAELEEEEARAAHDESNL